MLCQSLDFDRDDAFFWLHCLNGDFGEAEQVGSTMFCGGVERGQSGPRICTCFPLVVLRRWIVVVCSAHPDFLALLGTCRRFIQRVAG